MITATVKSTRTSGPRQLLNKRQTESTTKTAKIVSPFNFKHILELTNFQVNDAPAPFNTQFFHDDDFGPGFDDDPGYDGEGGGMAGEDSGEQDLLAATQGQTRRIRPEFVNYAKRAKRVDVRKLKENIWKGLDIVVAKQEPANKDADESMVRFSLYT